MFGDVFCRQESYGRQGRLLHLRPAGGGRPGRRPCAGGLQNAGRTDVGVAGHHKKRPARSADDRPWRLQNSQRPAIGRTTPGTQFPRTVGTYVERSPCTASVHAPMPIVRGEPPHSTTGPPTILPHPNAEFHTPPSCPHSCPSAPLSSLPQHVCVRPHPPESGDFARSASTGTVATDSTLDPTAAGLVISPRPPRNLPSDSLLQRFTIPVPRPSELASRLRHGVSGICPPTPTFEVLNSSFLPVGTTGDWSSHSIEPPTYRDR
jgi:hypothetical protein